MNTPPKPEGNIFDSIWNSGALRLLIIGFCSLVLLIPLEIVKYQIWERQQRQFEAVNEVSEKWGASQTVRGLALSIPYIRREVVRKNNVDEVREIIETAWFLPENLEVDGTVAPEVRKRGIFEVVLYSAQLHVKGKFLRPDFSEWHIAPEDIVWKDAKVMLGISDLRGIREKVTLKWDNENVVFNPGYSLPSQMETQNAIGANLNLTGEQGLPKKEYVFSFDLDIDGSSNLLFTPLGKTTEVHVQTGWKDVKYTGSFLPSSKDTSGDQAGASWKVLHLNRSFPQQFQGASASLDGFDFGLELINSVDGYDKAMRTAKYGALFIFLTYLTFFFVQMMTRARIHLVQYAIVGLGLIVFYLLLLAITEHSSFHTAYLIASSGIVLLITLYMASILRRLSLTLISFFSLGGLYLYIYVLIQLEDFALLAGSVGLFVLLAVLMFFTRREDFLKPRT